MISSIAELLIEPSEAVRMDIRNPEENIREVAFDSVKQLHSLRSCWSCISRLRCSSRCFRYSLGLAASI